MKIILSHQGNLVKILPRVKKAIFPHKFGRGDRAVTTAFTDRSRKNLLERFAIIDQAKAKNATFITLTYVENMQDHAKARRDIDTFLKRLLRVREGAFGVWKKELQDRGAIHFHLMIWNMPFLFKEWVAYTWGEITGSWQDAQCSDGTIEKIPPFTKIEYCKSQRKCWYYLSKYVAKVDKTSKSQVSVTGVIGNSLDTLERLQAQTASVMTTATEYRSCQVSAFAPANASGFNYGSNPTATPELQSTIQNETDETGDKTESTGRWWGWFNKKEIPLAENHISEIDCTWQEYRRFRWDLYRVIPHTNQIDLSHDLKLFWFDETTDPLTMLLRGRRGLKVFDQVDQWESNSATSEPIEYFRETC